MRHRLFFRLGWPGVVPAGVTLCQAVCRLTFGGTLFQVRDLFRRLRQCLAPVLRLVGLWSAEQAIRADDRRRAAVGACLEAAGADIRPLPHRGPCLTGRLAI